MRESLRRVGLGVVFSVLLIASTVCGQTAENYVEYLKEYDRRVAEQQAVMDRHQQGRWRVPAITIGAVVLLVAWSQRTSRHRVVALQEQSRAAIAEASEQNKRIIALLESIDRKTPGTDR